MTNQAPDRPRFTLTYEGQGVVATCQGCGWLIWTTTRPRTLAAAQEHQKKCNPKATK